MAVVSRGCRCKVKEFDELSGLPTQLAAGALAVYCNGVEAVQLARAAVPGTTLKLRLNGWFTFTVTRHEMLLPFCAHPVGNEVAWYVPVGGVGDGVNVSVTPGTSSGP